MRGVSRLCFFDAEGRRDAEGDLTQRRKGAKGECVMDTMMQMFGLVLVAVGIAMMVGGVVGLVRWVRK